MISKAISHVENVTYLKESILLNLNKVKNIPHRIGVTGPPGSGKSTLVNQLIKFFRKDKKRVAVLLVDPSSPFSHGSVLGDRIRVNDYYDDQDVFIRSVPSRDSTGGLSHNISEISDVLESASFDIIIYETVGVGQVEIDVVKEVDSVVLTLVPESGDDIQMMKAGILEIANIYVINKYDRKDSNRLYRSLTNMLSINEKSYLEHDWKPHILKTVAIKDEGIEDLYNSLNIHRKFINENNRTSIYSIRYKSKVKKILADYYIFLNNDVEVTKNWLNPMFNMFEENSKIGSCQPKILSYDKKNSFEYAGAAGGYLDYLAYPYCKGRIFDTTENDNGQYDEESEIFWSSGSCMMIRSEIFFESGGFDEDFFAHMEEIDLCWRIKRMGFTNYYQPKSKIFHKGGGTLSYEDPNKTYLNFRNNLIMLTKNEKLINLLFKIPLRVIMDITASIKILIEKKSFMLFFLVFKSYLSFLIAFPKIILFKRDNKLKRIEMDNIIIPIDYYIKGKKRYSDL